MAVGCASMFLRCRAVYREEADVQLKCLYNPVSDIDVAATFFRDQLGFEEAWRDGSLTVAFRIPDGIAQVMCSLPDQPPGPMYVVDDLDDWIDTHPTSR